MKRTGIVAVALLALAACKHSGTVSQGEDIQIVGTEVDSTKYGVLVDVRGDSMRWINEEGDTLRTYIAGAIVHGDLNAGNRLAVLYDFSKSAAVKSVIDMTQLMGRWVEPDAVDEGTVHGFELQEGGAASSINSRANHYVSWRVYNGKLLMVNSLDGMVDQDAPEDTFVITRLTKDSLRVGNRFAKHYFRRSTGDTDQEVEYEMYESPDTHAFDPEGEAPEGSAAEIPEEDRVF